ncbi:MAG: hypothetical protein ACKVSF_11120 [Alphaproteobacteria bacterium]
MSEFACVVNGVLHRVSNLPEQPPDIPHKGVRWYPVVREEGALETKALVGDNFVITTAPPLPPSVVSMRQARIALSRAGKLAAVEAAVAAVGGETKITWEYATQIERALPMLAALAQALGLSDADLDALFTVAGSV